LVKGALRADKVGLGKARNDDEIKAGLHKLQSELDASINANMQIFVRE
jgi:hypothetical protein